MLAVRHLAGSASSLVLLATVATAPVGEGAGERAEPARVADVARGVDGPATIATRGGSASRGDLATPERTTAMVRRPALSRTDARAMARIPEGSYAPLYEQRGAGRVHVRGFRIDREPVTRGEFRRFLIDNPRWMRDSVAKVFADRRSYLADWDADAESRDPDFLRRPVVNVSWFAARAYCAAQGKRLPTVHEWEYVAAASGTSPDAARDPRFIQSLVSRYASRPRPLPPVESTDANLHGVRGLHGFAWEWVEDFNSVLVSNDSRGVGAREHDAWCASATIGAVDPSNYPAFLRFAMRAGLTGRTSLETLGFRCAA